VSLFMEPRPSYTFCKVHGPNVGPCPYCKAGVELTKKILEDNAELLMKKPPYQKFWRCAHYPSAISNFFSTRQTCEWDCHTQDLRWHDHGDNQPPKSWGGAPRPIIGV
jgi:hypothetical protein